MEQLTEDIPILDKLIFHGLTQQHPYPKNLKKYLVKSNTKYGTI